jgi:hypothetical protein
VLVQSERLGGSSPGAGIVLRTQDLGEREPRLGGALDVVRLGADVDGVTCELLRRDDIGARCANVRSEECEVCLDFDVLGGAQLLAELAHRSASSMASSRNAEMSSFAVRESS